MARRRVQIHRGATRTVLLIGPWAVKVPSLRSNGNGFRGVASSICHGFLANLSEATWSEVEGVCPVRWSVNIYPRCEPVESFDGDYSTIGASYLPPLDRKPQNLGVLEGRIVWIDYA